MMQIPELDAAGFGASTGRGLAEPIGLIPISDVGDMDGAMAGVNVGASLMVRLEG